MPRYDLSKIMKRAHQLFINARAKYPTFADALRKSWSMAKFEVKVAETRQAIEAEAKAERMKGEIAARKEGITYNEYQDRISRAMGYGCGVYCGD